MRSIKFYLILLFAICTFAVNAQTPQGDPANYACSSASLYPISRHWFTILNMQKRHTINSPCRQ